VSTHLQTFTEDQTVTKLLNYPFQVLKSDNFSRNFAPLSRCNCIALRMQRTSPPPQFIRATSNLLKCQNNKWTVPLYSEVCGHHWVRIQHGDTDEPV